MARSFYDVVTENDDDLRFGNRAPAKSNAARYQERERERFNDMTCQVEATRERSLQSTQRSLAAIAESEHVGQATAVELQRQGEQLSRIQSQADHVNNTMTTSQRHLNSIKSVFGGIKNYFAAKPRDDIAGPPRVDDVDSSHMPRSQSAYASSNHDHEGARMSGVSDLRITQTRFGSNAREEEINTNLTEMSGGMSRLKGLAEGLSTEIERQNAQLDQLDGSVNRADIRIKDQNRQMYKILGKKPSDVEKTSS